jgi:adenine-specific DNA-methyltransferase
MQVEWRKWDDVEIIGAPSAIVIHTTSKKNDISKICSELKLIEDISFSCGGTEYVEIKPKGINKGKALERVAELLDLKKNQVLAIGDNDNDAEMLAWVGIGIAIDSASALAIKESKYKATRGVIDGAIEVLRLVRSATKKFYSQKKESRQAKAKVSSELKGIYSTNVIMNDSNSIVSNSVFITKDKILSYLKQKHMGVVDVIKLDLIINEGILPVFRRKEQELVLKSDIYSLIDLFCIPEIEKANKLKNKQLFDQNVFYISPFTKIYAPNSSTEMTPVYFSAFRNMVSAHKNLLDVTTDTEQSMFYFGKAKLSTLSKEIFDYANEQTAREKNVNMNISSQLARSAYYMGSKRSLCCFLVEAISSVLPKSGVVIDLMCGSGVTSGAFNKVWRTISSDALNFCRVLATIHGGGFSSIKAENLLSRILPKSNQHYLELKKNLVGVIEQEDKLFCKNVDESLCLEYRDFIKNFPTMTNGAAKRQWNPQFEVDIRKSERSRYPYCLFTSCFANIYFGIRQSVEIDSIRYSIEQLQNIDDKNWALGALIATVSALGTTYGGHFAQPLIRNYNDINIRNLSNIVNKRASSITHEFSSRLKKLAEQSQKSERSIKTVQGPWGNALSVLSKELKRESVLVYLDAPYTREEYSRYYHVLETLVLYNYPTCMGIGLTPKPSERFRSEFFTKINTRITDIFIQIISNVLQKGWKCAWSYSDSGMADIVEVINSVCSGNCCEVKSFSVPFIHKSHGGVKPKNVIEYLIIFSPKIN